MHDRKLKGPYASLIANEKKSNTSHHYKWLFSLLSFYDDNKLTAICLITILCHYDKKSNTSHHYEWVFSSLVSLMIMNLQLSAWPPIMIRKVIPATIMNGYSPSLVSMMIDLLLSAWLPIMIK